MSGADMNGLLAVALAIQYERDDARALAWQQAEALCDQRDCCASFACAIANGPWDLREVQPW